ncbi:MAG: hypothetical protein ACJA2M_000746, partial [Polaribacter sp.]
TAVIIQPTAVDDSVTVVQDSGTILIDVLANDSFGPDGAAVTNSLSVSAGTSAHGTISVTAGKIAYTSTAGYSGPDTFDYTIETANGGQSTATVNVTVENAVNVPTAFDDAVTVAQDSAENVISILLDNGSGSDYFGADGPNAIHPISLSGSYTDLGGKLELDVNVVKYTPSVGFSGVDSFSYTITDTTGDAATAIVTVTVTAVIIQPTAVDDSVTVVQDSGTILIDVLANDSFGPDGAAVSNSLSVSVGTSAHGTISVTAGKIAYTSTAGYSGPDTFDYTIETANGGQSTATVNVTVEDAVNVPTAFDDAVTVTQDSAENVISILLDNGSGSDSFGADGPNATHPISLSGSYTDLGGKLELDVNVVKYTPSAGFSGVDSFSYILTDTTGDSSTAKVTVTVTPATSRIATKTNDNILDNEFLVYPNPSIGNVKVTLKSNVSEDVRVILTDITGRVIYSAPLKLREGQNELDFNVRAKPGVLFIRVLSSKTNYGVTKIIFK